MGHRKYFSKNFDAKGRLHGPRATPPPYPLPWRGHARVRLGRQEALTRAGTE